MNPAYLVIDQGGHGTRGLVFDAVGNIVLSVHAPVTTINKQSGWYEQDVDNLVASVHSCLQQLETPLGQKCINIASAALITQRSSLLACYKDTLNPITPIISWQDTRNNAWLQQRINDGQFNVNNLKKLTGLRLNAHYGASKIRWLLDNDPGVQEASRQGNLIFLPLAAFVTHLLTTPTKALVDAASASRTFLTEFGQTTWSQQLLDLFCIDRKMLPEIVTSKFDFGNIKIADQLIPLQLVGGDQSFLPFAYGANALDTALFINAGTGAFVQTVLSPQETPTALLCSVAALEQNRQVTVAEGTVNACASALDWLFENAGQQLSHADIENALQSVTSPPIFYHRITALGSPYWLPVGISAFSDHHATREASLAEKTVAVIESIIFLLAINIDLLQHAKPELQHILISGGICNADGFCQKLANVCRLPVLRCADHEASSRGAAFYLGGIGEYPGITSATRFNSLYDNSLLARYQHFYEWLRNEWLKNNEIM